MKRPARRFHPIGVCPPWFRTRNRSHLAELVRLPAQPPSLRAVAGTLCRQGIHNAAEHLAVGRGLGAPNGVDRTFFVCGWHCGIFAHEGLQRGDRWWYLEVAGTGDARVRCQRSQPTRLPFPITIPTESIFRDGAAHPTSDGTALPGPAGGQDVTDNVVYFPELDADPDPFPLCLTDLAENLIHRLPSGTSRGATSFAVLVHQTGRTGKELGDR